ncbi:HAD family hydrolase [Streptomyces sp. G44]|uniref:HAD family hydrolase n=1 Tax=Streptomyces sp. G44 TaxID=2807632 RepID=UPI0019607A04|nr:HAD-IA family hydrolase [Streptomyces sp. G44]MBM7169813.1 HAD family hydrolase [Streptomyces sp. G44]
MTADSTQSDAIWPETFGTETERIHDLIDPVRFVLFDFDGPICRLFAGHSARKVAEDQVRCLAGLGLPGLLSEEERRQPDPYLVLRAVDRRRPRSDLVEELEKRLTQQELSAVASAFPTPYVDPLIRTWTAVGARLAVTTNNSPGAVRRYLASRGLLECFAPHIYGRTRDLRLLKPDPHCLHRAVRAMGADPKTTLMIGDAPTDFEAAQRAGVGFLGYARNERKARLLREAGARHLVPSLEPLLERLRGSR